MQSKFGRALLAAAVVAAAAALSGAAAAGEDDINPVFAGMAELPRAYLDRANGRGADDALQSASVTIVGAGIELGENGEAVQLVLPEISCGSCINDLGSAFSGASAVAAITQNNGSNNAINNLVLVETHMHD